MKKRVLALCSVLALVIATVLGLSLGRTSAVRSTPMAARLDAPGNAVADSRPLRDRARNAGHVVELERPRARVFADLADLTANSTAVIIGIPQENISNLSPDGRTITLDYKVRVEYVYRGRLQEGSIITVSLPGGMWSFEDGSVAEVRTPWFKKMQHGRAYALFLTPGSRSGTFLTTGEAQGLFEIPTTRERREVQAHVGLPQYAIRRYHGMDVRTFLRELRQVTGRRLNN